MVYSFHEWIMLKDFHSLLKKQIRFSLLWFYKLPLQHQRWNMSHLHWNQLSFFIFSQRAWGDTSEKHCQSYELSLVHHLPSKCVSHRALQPHFITLMKELRTEYYHIPFNNDKSWCDMCPPPPPPPPHKKACELRQVITNWVKHKSIGDNSQKD